MGNKVNIRLHIITAFCAGALLIAAGCNTRTAGVWEEHPSASANKVRVDKSLWGNEEEATLALNPTDLVHTQEEEFVPLRDEDLRAQAGDGAVPQPAEEPGMGGTPSLDQYRAAYGHLAAIFQTVYFNTDDHILRGREYAAAIDKIAAYLREHPNTYLFVEGHCDERGPEAYNLALGARRSNYVRTLLVQKGVDPDRVQTISYGKEKPALTGHNAQAWSKNRRAEFKIYQKS
jgi:peptidoglycan-associated lipoprotein